MVVRDEGKVLDGDKLAALVELELPSPNDDVLITIEGKRARVLVRREAGAALSADIDVTPSSRGGAERMLALFVGELARGATADERVSEGLTTLPVPTSKNDAAPPDTSMRSASPGLAAREQHAQLRAGVSGRAFTSGGTFFLGPILGASITLRERLRLGAQGRYARASERTSLGTVDAMSLDANLSAGYTLASVRGIGLELGLGAEGGLVEGQGTGQGSSATRRPSLSAISFVEASGFIGGPFSLALALEAGMTVLGLDLLADQQPVLRASDPFAGLRLSLGLGR